MDTIHENRLYISPRSKCVVGSLLCRIFRIFQICRSGWRKKNLITFNIYASFGLCVFCGLQPSPLCCGLIFALTSILWEGSVWVHVLHMKIYLPFLLQYTVRSLFISYTLLLLLLCVCRLWWFSESVEDIRLVAACTSKPSRMKRAIIWTNRCYFLGNLFPNVYIFLQHATAHDYYMRVSECVNVRGGIYMHNRLDRSCAIYPYIRHQLTHYNTFLHLIITLFVYIAGNQAAWALTTLMAVLLLCSCFHNKLRTLLFTNIFIKVL